MNSPRSNLVASDPAALTGKRVQLPRYDHCFVCGRKNEIGLDITFFANPSHIETRFVPQACHTGYHNTVHGGLLATLLDETMGWASIFSRPVLCLSVELSIRYKNPARIGEPLTVIGKLVADKKRVIVTQGMIYNSNQELVCTAEGKYIPLSAEENEKVAQYARWGNKLQEVFHAIQSWNEK